MSQNSSLNRLPLEIRLQIWAECIPSRVFDILGTYALGKMAKMKCKMEHTSRRNRQIPTIAHVCRESRSVVLAMGKRVPLAHCGSAWFTPQLDIAFNPWVPDDGWKLWGWNNDINPEHFEYGDRCQGGRHMCIEDRRFHTLDLAQEEWKDDWPNEDLQVLGSKSKEWLVTVETIAIHCTPEQAGESGLFGLLGDAPIQLVDARDRAVISRYGALWASTSPDDQEAGGLFNHQDAFQERVGEWCQEVETVWVWNEWYFHSRNEKRPVCEWEGEDLWSGPEDYYFNYNRLPPLDIRYFSLNRDHPFVKDCLERMPRFYPQVMFRHCSQGCHR